MDALIRWIDSVTADPARRDLNGESDHVVVGIAKMLDYDPTCPGILGGPHHAMSVSKGLLMLLTRPFRVRLLTTSAGRSSSSPIASDCAKTASTA